MVNLYKLNKTQLNSMTKKDIIASLLSSGSAPVTVPTIKQDVSTCVLEQSVSLPKLEEHLSTALGVVSYGTTNALTDIVERIKAVSINIETATKEVTDVYGSTVESAEEDCEKDVDKLKVNLETKQTTYEEVLAKAKEQAETTRVKLYALLLQEKNKLTRVKAENEVAVAISFAKFKEAHIIEPKVSALRTERQELDTKLTLAIVNTKDKIRNTYQEIGMYTSFKELDEKLQSAKDSTDTKQKVAVASAVHSINAEHAHKMKMLGNEEAELLATVDALLLEAERVRILEANKVEREHALATAKVGVVGLEKQIEALKTTNDNISKVKGK